MADHCGICDTHRPEGGTNHLVLNDGELWIEFCESCGEKHMFTNGETGEKVSVKALYDRLIDLLLSELQAHDIGG